MTVQQTIKAREARILKGLMTECEVFEYLQTTNDFMTNKQIEIGCNLKRGAVQAALKRLDKKGKVVKDLRADFQKGKMFAYYQAVGTP